MPHLSTPVNLENAGIALSINSTHIGKKSKSDRDWDQYNKSFIPSVKTINGIAETISSGWAIAPVVHKSRSLDNFVSTQLLGADFDSSSISNLLSDQFVRDYAAIVHTTSSHKPEAPRSRSIFILEEPIHDPLVFSEIATATTWYCDQSDPQCKDAARLWFGAKDCQIEIDAAKRLPMSVIQNIVSEYRISQETLPENSGFSHGDPESILNDAIKSIKPGNRNTTGFEMCCRLRDIGIDKSEAVEYARIFQSAANLVGDHPYEMSEILSSLRSAYSRKPRRHSQDGLNRMLSQWEYNAWHHRSGLKKGALHYSLKTVMAITQIAEKAGRTTNLNLPVRDFIDYGIPKTAASKHLKAMIDGGTLVIEKKDIRRGNRYSLLVDPTSDTADFTGVINIEMSDAYKSIQGMPHFDYGARIDSKMWAGAPPSWTLGPSALRIIASLKICAEVGHSRSEGDCTSAECPTSAHILSMNELWKVAGIGSRTGQQCFKTLVELGICTWEFADNKSKMPTLTENWYERLKEIEPALTTFGNKEKRKLNYSIQRELHHDKFSKFGAEADRKVSENAGEHAGRQIAKSQSELQRVRNKKDSWKKRVAVDYNSKSNA